MIPDFRSPVAISNAMALMKAAHLRNTDGVIATA
jgi:hypothetical protein